METTQNANKKFVCIETDSPFFAVGKEYDFEGSQFWSATRIVGSITTDEGFMIRGRMNMYTGRDWVFINKRDESAAFFQEVK